MTNASTPTRRLGYLTTVIMLAVLGLAVATLLQGRTSSGTINALSASDIVAACRDELRAVVDLATASVDETDGARDAVILDGLIAVARDDSAALADMVQRAEASQMAAQVALNDLHDAVVSYAEGVEQSRTDPDTFTRRCER